MKLLIEDIIYDNTWYNTSRNISLPVDISRSLEIGIHCGSVNQALKRHPDMNLYLVKLEPNIRCFNIPDDCDGLWGDLTSVRLFKAYDIISYEEFINLQVLVRSAYTQLERSEIMRNFFVNKGYDAFTYKNNLEDPKDKHPGLCIFNPNKIQRLIQIDKDTLQPINERIKGDNMIKLIKESNEEDQAIFYRQTLRDMNNKELLDHYAQIVLQNNGTRGKYADMIRMIKEEFLERMR